MNKSILHFCLFICLLTFWGCSDNVGTVEVTYKKATAIYGDLEEVRQTPLLDQSRDVENPGKIFISDQLLLIGEEEKGVHVVDNSDPENPMPTHFINIPGNREFYVKGNFLYAESYYDMLKIDISQIGQPKLVSRVRNAFTEELKNNLGESLIGFRFEEVTEELDRNDDLFTTPFEEDQWIYFDYAQNIIPPSAVPASFAGNSGSSIGTVNRVAQHEGHVYVISNSNLFVFSDNDNMELLSTNGIGWQMETVYPYGDHLFIGTRNSMNIIDISNPAQPNWFGFFQHGTACDPVLPVGSVAYVTLRTGDVGQCPGDENALVVVDVSNLSNPFELQEVEMESPFGMTMIGDKLYVGEGSNGLKIFDATDRADLKLEQWDRSVEAYDVIAHPVRNDLLLIAGPGGLGQYKIEGTSTLDLVSWMSL